MIDIDRERTIAIKSNKNNTNNKKEMFNLFLEKIKESQNNKSYLCILLTQSDKDLNNNTLSLTISADTNRITESVYVSELIRLIIHLREKGLEDLTK